MEFWGPTQESPHKTSGLKFCRRPSGSVPSGLREIWLGKVEVEYVAAIVEVVGEERKEEGKKEKQEDC